MPLDFPSSPTNGQYYNGFVWNDANQTWDSAYAPRAATIPISSPNVIINGAFDIWQRGAGPFSISNGQSYSADRWVGGSSNGTSAISQQTFTPGTAPAASFEGKYFLRHAVTTIGTMTALGTYQRIEDVRTFAGQTVTVSLWAKADAARTLSVRIDQDFGTGGSSYVVGTAQSTAITTSWARYTFTFTVAGISGKTINATDSKLVLVTEATCATGSYVDLWGVQMEAGAAATDFRRNAPSIAGELAACQRYYWRLASGSSYWVGAGWYYSASQVSVNVQFPVTMRTAPTADISNGTNHFYVDSSAGAGNIPTLSIYWPQPTSCLLYYPSSPVGTTGKAVAVNTSNAAAYVGFSAEL